MTQSQPLVDGRYEDGRLVADRELVIPRGHGTVSFEAMDTAFDRVRRALQSPQPVFAAVLTDMIRNVRDDPAGAGSRRHSVGFFADILPVYFDPLEAHTDGIDEDIETVCA